MNLIFYFMFLVKMILTNEKIILSVHAGAGSYIRDKIDLNNELEIKRGIMKALKAGYNVLKNHQTPNINPNEISLEAVKRAVIELEDYPIFNAGKGGKINQNFEVELDSSIMNGFNFQCGAVAGVKRIKNPITAAERVMKNTNHILLAGESADKFAINEKIDIVDNFYFFTKKTIKEWIEHAIEKFYFLCTKKETFNKKCKRFKYSLEYLEIVDKSDYNKKYNLLKEISEIILELENSPVKQNVRGTVGAVALDDNSNLSAGTSTGGTTFKMAGRIGDSPIIGAGTYANKEIAISCTGTGEEFIKRSVAYDISAKMKYLNKSLKEASTEMLDEFIEDMGGFIAIDKFGNVETLFNTLGMARGTVSDNGDVYIEIFGGNSSYNDITPLNYNINDSI